MFRRLRAFALAGLIVLFPVAATYWAMIWLFESLDNSLRPVLEMVFGRPLPGIGVVAGLVLVITVGAITTNLLGRQVITAVQGFLLRVPLIRSVYGVAKSLTDALMGTQRRAFREVVVVEYPRAGMYSIGFVTARHGQMVTMFVPTVPNPTAGWFLLVPEDQVEALPVSVEDGLKWTVSGGIIVPNAAVPAAAWQAILRLESRRRAGPAERAG